MAGRSGAAQTRRLATVRALPVLLMALGSVPGAGSAVAGESRRVAWIGAMDVQAVCTERGTGNKIVLTGAQIGAGEPSGLMLRLGAAPAQAFALAQVARIELTGAETGADGYARATIELREPAYRGLGSILLRPDGKPLRLGGTSSGNVRAEVALERCAELVLRLRPPADAAARGGSKS